MRFSAIAAVALTALMAGCSAPPKVRDCDGEFHPVNAENKSASLNHTQSVALCKKGGSDEQQG